MPNPAAKLISAARRALRRFAGLQAATEAIAAVEFALIAPMLVLFMLCTVDIGMGYYRQMQVQNAARAGAQYAIAHGFVASAISGAVLSATGFAGISASPAPSQFCGCAASTGITSAACDATCAGGAPAATYVTVSAQGAYATLLPYPLLADSYILTAQATVRLQ